jgi:Ca-activated chloride channel family protein
MPTELTAAIAGIWPGGSTNLSGGWLKGVEELRRATGDGPRALVLLTDGRANVGVVETDRLVAMAGGARNQGALTSTIGFGADFDEDLLSAMADAGGGNAHYAPTPDAAPAIFAEEFDGLAATVAQNVSVEIRPGSDVEILAVLNDYPATPVAGGVQLALGDAWGGEHRRLVLRLGHPGGGAARDRGRSPSCASAGRM